MDSKSSERPFEAIVGRGKFGGWLSKAKSGGLSSKIGKKTKNYFTLNFDARELSFSRDNNASEISQRFHFDCILEAESTGDASFTLKTTERTYQLFAEAAKDASKWVIALRAAKDWAAKDKEPVVEDARRRTETMDTEESLQRSSFDAGEVAKIETAHSEASQTTSVQASAVALEVQQSSQKSDVAEASPPAIEPAAVAAAEVAPPAVKPPAAQPPAHWQTSTPVSASSAPPVADSQRIREPGKFSPLEVSRGSISTHTVAAPRSSMRFDWLCDMLPERCRKCLGNNN
mmetsp:Transcript_134003/g.245728  ORF Transcript_134003/g.245728 Transcript_134003/m.245728 type:complete len:288 (-) Transcript_134003:2-865(-)